MGGALAGHTLSFFSYLCTHTHSASQHPEQGRGGEVPTGLTPCAMCSHSNHVGGAGLPIPDRGKSVQHH